MTQSCWGTLRVAWVQGDEHRGSLMQKNCKVMCFGSKFSVPVPGDHMGQWEGKGGFAAEY